VAYSGMSNSQAREKIDAGERTSIKINEKLTIWRLICQHILLSIYY